MVGCAAALAVVAAATASVRVGGWTDELIDLQTSSWVHGNVVITD